jgi:hypothetical protein
LDGGTYWGSYYLVRFKAEYLSLHSKLKTEREPSPAFGLAGDPGKRIVLTLPQPLFPLL